MERNPNLCIFASVVALVVLVSFPVRCWCTEDSYKSLMEVWYYWPGYNHMILTIIWYLQRHAGYTRIFPGPFLRLTMADVNIFGDGGWNAQCLPQSNKLFFSLHVVFQAKPECCVSENIESKRSDDVDFDTFVSLMGRRSAAQPNSGLLLCSKCL